MIDLGSYDKYLADELENYTLTEEAMLASEKVFEDYPKPERIQSR